MKLGLFVEVQVPRPWSEGDEARAFHEALEQVELADQLGFDYVWVVEHHFLEEYSHSSAPELFLAACSQRTKNIRLGHGIVLMPPKYNPPARVAERIATLDILSHGRVEFGTGVSASRTELEGFDIDHRQRFSMWQEAVSQVTDMMAMTPYPGFSGEHFSMPCRNVVPKPLQKPHPPMWMACPKRDQVLFAARNGLGSLTFSFLDPSEARAWVDGYYQAFEECVPIGRRTNPNIAMVSALYVHQDGAVAEARAREGFEYFMHGLGYYYEFGTHKPGVSSVMDHYQQRRAQYADRPCPVGIGSVERVRADMLGFEAAGVDQVAFIVQSGRTSQAHVLESLRLFGERIMPELKAREPAAASAKAARVAGAVERAMARKVVRPELTPDEIPTHWPYARDLRVGAAITGALHGGGSGAVAAAEPAPAASPGAPAARARRAAKAPGAEAPARVPKGQKAARANKAKPRARSVAKSAR